MWPFRRTAAPREPGQTVADIEAFERSAGIALPEDFRRYAVDCTRGLIRPARRSGSVIECTVDNWYQPALEDERDPVARGRPFDGLTRGRDGLLCGSLRIFNAGCEYYDLLVISGDGRGTVQGEYDRIGPIAPSFTGYLGLGARERERRAAAL